MPWRWQGGTLLSLAIALCTNAEMMLKQLPYCPNYLMKISFNSALNLSYGGIALS